MRGIQFSATRTCARTRGQDPLHCARRSNSWTRLDPQWVVAGTAGVTRRGRLVRRVVYRGSGLTADRLPLSVVTLDENFLVFNRRNVPRCSPGLSGFHFYGSDVSMNALATVGLRT